MTRGLIHLLSRTGRTTKQLISISADAALAFGALWAAYSLRLGEPFTGISNTWYLFLLVPLFTVVLCVYLGVYRWVVRSSTQLLTLQLIKVSIAGSILVLSLLFLFPPQAEATPRSLFVIYGMIFGLSAIGLRTFWQWFASFKTVRNLGEPVAIFGAGSAGQQLVRLMSLAHEYKPVLFIDDSASMTGSTVSGLPVYSGHSESLSVQLKKHEISRIVLAVPSVKGDLYRSILNRMSSLGLPVQTTPSIMELVDGIASPDEIRDISLQDLLGRTQAIPDSQLIRQCVYGKTVLVTGGGGSIGSELCRQILDLSPGKLIILDQTEENLYNITEEVHRKIVQISLSDSDTRIPLFVPMLGSVSDESKIRKLFQQHRIDTVYHAAAYKHVPIVEQYPEEGIVTNILGTKMLLDTAVEAKVGTFVLISTDKAVRPTNAMGATKRIAEMVLQTKSQESHETKICMVRFGNVLGSSGSVVPKFKQQIASGGPVTLTHADITRYFMTIPEASQLVLQASSLASGGEVFVLDMGQPVKIIELARNMIRLHGKEVYNEATDTGDVRIEITGLRPGEKLYEELFVGENPRSTAVSKIMVENMPKPEVKAFNRELTALFDRLEHGSAEELKNSLVRIAWKFNDDTPQELSVSQPRSLTVELSSS